MNVEEAQIIVTGIKNLADIGDSEGAHNLEDFLYWEVVKEITEIEYRASYTYFDLAELVNLAKLALTTKDMKFERWCA